ALHPASGWIWRLRQNSLELAADTNTAGHCVCEARTNNGCVVRNKRGGRHELLQAQTCSQCPVLQSRDWDATELSFYCEGRTQLDTERNHPLVLGCVDTWLISRETI